jgi:putative endonuclease
VVLHRNLRVGRDELDLVTLDGGTLVAVEVRSARSGALVHPLESLGARKLQRLQGALLRFASGLGHRDVRIDVATVIDGVVDHLPGAVGDLRS